MESGSRFQYKGTDSNVSIHSGVDGQFLVTKHYLPHIAQTDLQLYHQIHQNLSGIKTEIRLKKSITIDNKTTVNKMIYEILDLGDCRQDGEMCISNPPYVPELAHAMSYLDRYRLARQLGEYIRDDLLLSMPFFKKLMVVPQNIKIHHQGDDYIHVVVTDLGSDIAQFLAHYRARLRHIN